MDSATELMRYTPDQYVAIAQKIKTAMDTGKVPVLVLPMGGGKTTIVPGVLNKITK